MMKSSSLYAVYVFFAVLLAGCAGATASAPQMQAAPIVNSRPSQIIVYPFSTSTTDVTLNQGIGARLYRNYSGENQDESAAKLAQDTAENVCLQIVTSLTSSGWKAICQPRGTPLNGSNSLIVDGEFTDISEGNRLRRMVIGLGAGASTLDTSVGLYHYSGGGSPTQLLTFTTHADSGKMPGAGITGPAGAAAGGAAAAASIGVNVAAAGVKNVTSATGYLGNKTAKQIVDQLNTYFSQQGWSNSPPSSS